MARVLAMGGKTTSTLDSKGRVLIPQGMRDELRMESGEKVVLSLDKANKCIVLEPAHEKKLLHLQIRLSDKPGALAHAASALAGLKVDLVSTQSHSSRRGESAVWLVECNPGDATLPQIKAALAREGAALESAKVF